MNCRVVHDICENVLGNIPENTVDLTFTSPPYYNAKDYSQYPSYDDYLLSMKNIFKMVFDITKEGKFLIVNSSPVIEAREKRSQSSKRYSIPFDLNYHIQQIGWEFLEDIIWVKPEPSVKNRNHQFKFNRKPLLYKPNLITEYIMVYRKKTDKLLEWNVKQYDKNIIEDSLVKEDYESNNVWKIQPEHSKTHPAIFPVKLSDNIIKYYSYKSDLVLDCFSGYGTTAVSCIRNDRKFLLIEKDKNYYDESILRIKKELFNNGELNNHIEYC